MISLDDFRAMAKTRRVIPVWEKVIADDLTPIALYDQLCHGRTGTFLLESAEAGKLGRWSIVGVRSDANLTSRDGEACWSGRDIAGLARRGDPVELLREALGELSIQRDPALPPFQAGLVGFLGYDVVRRLERLPEHTVDDLHIPELMFLLTSEVAILDHELGELWLVANAINWDGSPERVDQAYERAADAVARMRSTVIEPRRPLTATVGDAKSLEIRRQRSSAEFQGIVEQAQEEIKAGEAFQIVVSQRFDIPTSARPFDVYRALRITNPSPYMYFFNLEEFAIVGASPEALVKVRDGVATTRPIAGSRPRGATAQEDRRLAEELVADEKERAEHIMLVDLGRNDLGRICQPGSVVVEEMLNVHRYSHIMHLEAAVTGKLRPECSALDAVLACFPAGTLSGAPKVRAMEIIERLELTRRGLYGGVVGYLDFAGDAEVALAIRTAVIADGVAHVQAGAGVVKDSVPELEDAECSHKARAVVEALRKASSWL